MAANPRLQSKVLEVAIRAITGYYKKKLKNKYGIKDLTQGSPTGYAEIARPINDLCE